MSGTRKTLLIISQTFVPDPASVGQHMADVAVEMARRGYRVKVYTSARGYEDPTVKYPKRENLHGVEVRRLGLASFGKKTIFIDGKPAAESPVMRMSEGPWRFDVKIPQGSRRISLNVTHAGDGNLEDLGDWLDAGFVLRNNGVSQ